MALYRLITLTESQFLSVTRPETASYTSGNENTVFSVFQKSKNLKNRAKMESYNLPIRVGPTSSTALTVTESITPKLNACI